jgi:hypothetical protein
MARPAQGSTKYGAGFAGSDYANVKAWRFLGPRLIALGQCVDHMTSLVAIFKPSDRFIFAGMKR